MGKAKRATRKELEEIIGEIIQELGALRNGITGLGNFVGLYIEWKGDKLEFDKSLKSRIGEAQKNTGAPSMEGNHKSEKKDRYKKVSTPPL